VKRALLVLPLLAGCNSLLGIEDLELSDAGVVAPPNTVVGTSHLVYISSAGETRVPEDLSGYTFQAFLPDDTEPSGFRVVDGAGTADGSFTIENVPDGQAYYLKVVAPDAAGPSFYVTDLHVVDLDRSVGGRVDAQTVTIAQPVNLDLTNMQAWKAGDFLVAGAYNIATEGWNLETIVNPMPQPGATSLVTSYDWGCPNNCYSFRLDGRPALVDMSKGDTVHFAHVRQSETLDVQAVRWQQAWHIIDAFESSSVTMTSGQPTSIAGAFSPLTGAGAATIRFTVNRAMYDAGYDPQSQFVDVTIAAYASPGANRGVRVGLPLAGAQFLDWSRAALSTSSVDITYGDPTPAEWPHVLDLRYTRLRYYKIPGTSSPAVVFVGGSRFIDFVTTVPSTPDIAPPTGIQVAGAAASAGGRRAFDGVAPVVVSWVPVSTASQYRVTVSRLYADGTRTRRVSVAGLHTRESSVTIPAEVFTGSEYFAIQVSAIRNGGQLGAGHLRAEGFPYSDAINATGQLRLSASCGDGVPQSQSGEACDPGVTESPTCDIDCSAPLCGDGIVNAAAGEQCDSVFETPACDGDCTLPVCGDGYWNPSEDCDDGNTVDDGNGCSAACKANNACGDGVQQAAVEACDDGNQIDDGNGCTASCHGNNVCGNGVTESAVEQCDTGGESVTCDADCTVRACGDETINTTAGETCDPPQAGVCDSACHSL